MTKKNPDICEVPYCRERWTKTVHSFHSRNKRPWVLKVCNKCAVMYDYAPVTGITITRRATELVLNGE